MRTRRRVLAVAAAVLLAAPAAAATPGPQQRDWRGLCTTVDRVAAADGLSAAFLTRLLWQESRFRADALSPKGAQGVAQFMPPTARRRGLADPWDTTRAIAAAGRLLADLRVRFGNLGLAAAAYNAGADRVAKWLHADEGLPRETRRYVEIVTGRPVEDWVGETAGNRPAFPDADCTATIAALPQRAPAAAAPAPLQRVLAHALALAERQGR